MKKVNKELVDFVREGIIKAGDAYNTIILFEDSLKSIWKEVISEFNEWGDFEPDFKSIKFIHSNRPHLGSWMVMIVRGSKKSDKQVREFELGYTKKSRLYAAWRNDPKFFDYDNKVESLECNNTWSSVLSFSIDENDVFDVKEKYTILLKELLRYL